MQLQTRKPRSTQAEMDERRQHVLNMLADGPKSIAELIDGTAWSYPQAIITTRKMKADGEIVQTGKNGREVIFALSNEVSPMSPVDLTEIMEMISVGDNAAITGVSVTRDEVRVDLEFPSGKVVTAELVA